MARPLRGRSCCEGVMMGRRGRAIGGTPSWRPPRSDTARAGGNIWHDGQCQARPRGCRPIGVALLITAGKRSAPADRLPTPFRPHGGRTSFRRRAGAWKRGTGPWRVTASRCPRVRLWLTRGYQRFDPYGVACLAVWLWGALGSPCGRPRCIFAGVGPLWGPIVGRVLSAGSPLAHPRLSKVRPLWGRRPRGVALGCGGYSLRPAAVYLRGC